MEIEASTLNGCTLSGNSAGCGGGACYGTLNNCALTGNSAYCGGGASYGTLNNCVLTANSAHDYGGGAYYGTLKNCALTGNCAAYYGGGAHEGTLSNSTLVANWAGQYGGGSCSSTLRNCVIYYNTARLDGDNCYETTLNYCCTTPLPTRGTGNISAEPQLAGNWHLSAASPCRGAGSATYATGRDIDGEPWASPPSIGCDEYWSGSLTGALSVVIDAAHTNVAAGFGVSFQGQIGGMASASRWVFGDGVVVSNRPYAAHAWSAPGDYTVELRAYNGSYPGGVAASLVVHVVAQPVHYVALGSASPVAPYTSWVTAANNIQDAVDSVTVAGALVLVRDGLYQTGAAAVYGMSNRVAVTKPAMVRSVNGPAVTIIAGYGLVGAAAVRCVYLTNGAVLSGFTLTNGATQALGDSFTSRSGGAVWCESASVVVTNCTLIGSMASYNGGAACSGTLNNCTLTANSATDYGGGTYYCTLNNCTLTGNSGFFGGGAFSGTLNNCTLMGNLASAGGGAFAVTLNNCTLVANSASSAGGGAYNCGLNNCIVYYNSAPSASNCDSSMLRYSCTTPSPDGVGNITSAPLFVNTNGWSNLRLQSNSPCIDAGTNTSVTWAFDLDGQPRIRGGTVDMGAYEYHPLDAFHAWLGQYGLPTYGAADYADSDGDGLNNWQEWIAGTNPTNASSALWMLTPTSTEPGVTVAWTSVTNRSYSLESSADLTGPAGFSVLRSNLAGLPSTTSYTDTNVANLPRFYRVRVEH